MLFLLLSRPGRSDHFTTSYESQPASTGPALRLIPATPVENPDIASDPGTGTGTGLSQANSVQSSVEPGKKKKSSHSSSLSCLAKYSFKKSQSDKEKSGEKQSKSRKSIKKSIRLMKNQSMRKTDSLQDSQSEGSIAKLPSNKSSFSRVLDKIRGASRRSSVMSASSGGQAEFLASISRMSDSRIVENWLLSIEDDQLQEPPPPPLECLTLPSKRCDQATPTNEHFDSDLKATETRPTFELSSEEEEDEEEDLGLNRRQSMFKPVKFGRQYSESSEYTTDTHDTGETAHVTAMNTLSNTGQMFTCVGEEIKKVTLSPSQTVFRPIPSSNDVQSYVSTDTLRSVSSNPQIPGNASVGSDLQGSGE